MRSIKYNVVVLQTKATAASQPISKRQKALQKAKSDMVEIRKKRNL
jgi:type II secretory pathway component PulC